MWGGLNRRHFPRLNVQCDVFIRAEDSPYSISTYTENIGVGGICIIIDTALKRFSIVNVKLMLDDGGPAIECIGKIVWLIESKKLKVPEKRYDVGIEFLTISNNDRERIRKFIDANEDAVS